MPSPFPGMDPYLEGPTHWSDFHHEFVGALRSRINEILPEPYAARLGEYVVLERGLRLPEGRAVVPDVAVVRDDARGGGTATATVADVATTPITLRNIELLDDITETYIELVRLPDEEIVTAIELLSPTNKYGSGRGDYFRKRREFMRQGVNFVEIDIQGAGPRIELVQPLPSSDYLVYVWRSIRPAVTDVYPWTVRDRFPVIKLPLKAPDPDVTLDLAVPFSEAFDRGRYNRFLKREQLPPPPAFPSTDVEWVLERHRQRT